VFPPRSSHPRSSGMISRRTSTLVRVTQFKDGRELLRFSAFEPRWRPSETDWARIKRQSLETDANIIIAGVNHAPQDHSVVNQRAHSDLEGQGG